jgi:hypothetical protein
MYKISSFLIVTILFFQSCRKDEIRFDNGEPLYSFFVAGHSYGNPLDTALGLHPPFVNQFNYINNDFIDFGVLTGDMVKESTIEHWDAVDKELDLLDMPKYFVAGNHDVLDRDLYEARYGESYYSFLHEKDLFIVLDGNIDNWRISGNQLKFLENSLNTKFTENIFIFSHQLIYSDIRPDLANSEEGKSDELNFKTEVMPMLKKSGKQVFVIAGDVGAFNWGVSLFHDTHEGINLIASGMGGGEKDNFLIVDVMPNKTVRFRVIALNGDDINAMGQLTDY